MKTPRLLIITLLWVGVIANISAGQLTLSGDLVQGGLVLGQTDPGAKVEFEGRSLRVSKVGIFLIGFDRDAQQQQLPLQVTYSDGSVERREIRVRKRQYRIQRIDGLPKKTVTPDAKDLIRIRREAEKIRLVRQSDSARADFLVGFLWPVIGPISGVYGSQRILNGQPRRPHYGVDIAMPVGTQVVAPAPGVVTFAHRDMYFSGATLLVDHGHGLSSAFLHLSKIVVKVGQRVAQGQRIAEVGASGRVTGAHLDWRMNWFKHRIDPQLLAGPMPKQARH